MTTRTSSSAADQAAVAAVPQRAVDAWDANDAGAFSDVFVEDATMILPGVFRQGREKIRSFMAAAFSGPLKGTRMIGQPVKVRFLGDAAALVITEGGVIEAGRDEVSDARAIRASWLIVRQDGQWRLAAYQNTPSKQI
jgi:uncharacterized protein (TIGR02246 family)